MIIRGKDSGRFYAIVLNLKKLKEKKK